MLEKEIICIGCPLGCRLKIKYKEDYSEINVEGYTCLRGKEYGEEEIKSPHRILTAVVATDSEENPYLPVKSSKPVRKDMIFDILRKIYKVKVSLPKKVGDIIIENVDGDGSNIIATREIKSQDK